MSGVNHPVIFADLREDRPHAGRDGGLADPGGGVMAMDHKAGRR